MFKVGDWVEVTTTNQPRIIKKVIQASSIQDTVTISDGANVSIILRSDLKLWEPKPKEWCYFGNVDSNTAVLAQFAKRFYDGRFWNYMTTEGKCYLYCDPFTHKLPSFLKENI